MTIEMQVARLVDAFTKCGAGGRFAKYTVKAMAPFIQMTAVDRHLDLCYRVLSEEYLKQQRGINIAITAAIDIKGLAGDRKEYQIHLQNLQNCNVKLNDNPKDMSIFFNTGTRTVLVEIDGIWVEIAPINGDASRITTNAVFNYLAETRGETTVADARVYTNYGEVVIEYGGKTDRTASSLHEFIQTWDTE